MGRWEPDARGRLATAALALYAEQGFEGTTAAEIARAAGLSESSYFRHFADKREVLFAAFDSAGELLTTSIADSQAGASPWDVTITAIDALCTFVQNEPEIGRQRIEVIAANPSLRERDLSKHAELATLIARALGARGVPLLTAEVVAETAMAAYQVAVAAWAAGGPALQLPALFRSTIEELRRAIP